MNLNQLQYFVTLAHLEHYTKAAEVLGSTQPNLSHAIHALEQEIGAPLFQKQGRNIVLTKYGKLFLQYAEESLSTLKTGFQKVDSMNSNNSGQIHLAYIYTMGFSATPKIVRTFLNQHPDLKVDFQFTVGNTSEILSGLKDERYDIAFCSQCEEESDILFSPILKEDLVVVVPSSHPLALKNQPVDIADLAGEPLISFTPQSGLRTKIDQLFEQAGITPNVAYEIQEDYSMAGLAAEGFGLAIMPDIPIFKALNIKTLEIRSPHYERYIYLAQLKNKYTAPVVRAFIEHILQEYK